MSSRWSFGPSPTCRSISIVSIPYVKIHDKGTVGVQREPTQRFDARKSRVSFGGDHIKVFGRDSRYLTLAVESISSNHYFIGSVK